MKQVSKNEMEKEKERGMGKKTQNTSYSLALIWNTWDFWWYQVKMGGAKKQEVLKSLSFLWQGAG